MRLHARGRAGPEPPSLNPEHCFQIKQMGLLMCMPSASGRHAAELQQLVILTWVRSAWRLGGEGRCGVGCPVVCGCPKGMAGHRGRSAPVTGFRVEGLGTQRQISTQSQEQRRSAARPVDAGQQGSGLLESQSPRCPAPTPCLRVDAEGGPRGRRRGALLRVRVSGGGRL
jgi:hypothetical protein